MRERAIAVAGGGVAGLSAALLLARDGHRVTLLERDRINVGVALDAPSWERKGIPHFLQPHAFIPRGRLELRERLPDVYSALLAAGAYDLDLRRKLPGTVAPEDADFQYLAVRRPLIEWGLRQAVASDTRITVLDGVRVTGLTVAAGRVTGLAIGGSDLDVDLVVDALGRRSPVSRWLDEAGAGIGDVETTDCGVIYYCRYYAQRDGFDLPDGPWLVSPRGDLGYIGYATFPGDNRTFGSVLAVPTGVAEWRALKDPAAYEPAVAQIPILRQWVDPAGVDPITDVLPMAGLHNTIRHYEPAAAVGLVPVGDSLSHTDPVLAHGLSFALIHAGALAAALREHDDLGDAAVAYAAAVMPALRERFRLASELDSQRRRMWLGGDVDFAHSDGDYALFSIMAAGPAAMADPDVFRVFVRRIGLLDSTEVLDRDPAMQRRIEELFEKAMSTPRPPPGPPRDEMLALISA